MPGQRDPQKAALYDKLRAEGKTHREAIDEIEGVSAISAAIGPKAELGRFSQQIGRRPSVAKALGGATVDLGRTVAQGIPVVGPWADEAIGTVRGALTPGMSAAEGRDAEAKAIQRIHATNPFALPVELATAITTGRGIAAAKQTPAAIRALVTGLDKGKILPRIAGNVALGATSGAIAGSGAAQKGEGVGGAKVGALVGGLAAPLAEIPAGVKYARAKWEGFRAGREPEAIAGKVLGQATEADEMDLPRLIRQSKPDERLIDVAQPFTKATLEGALRVPSAEATQTRRVLTQRAALPEPPAALLAKATGVDRNTGNLRATEDIEEALRPGISKAYKEIMGKHQQLIDPKLTAFLADPNPIVQTAVATARRAVARADKPSFVNAAGEHMDQGLEFFDHLKRAIQAQAKTTNSTLRQQATNKAHELIDILDPLTAGEYATARGLDQERRAYQKAVDLGGRVARAEDVRDADLMLDKAMKGVKDPATRANARTAFRKGIARDLVNQVDNVSGDAAGLTKFFQTAGGERKARLAFPDDRSFDAFAAQGRALLKPILAAEAAAGNPQAIKFSEPDVFERLTPWAIASALRGNPMLAVAQAAGATEARQFAKKEMLAAPILAKAAGLPLRDPQMGEIARSVARWSSTGERQGADAITRIVQSARRKSGVTNRASVQAILNSIFTPKNDQQ